MTSSDNINFPKAEEEVLEFWRRIDAFQTSFKQSQGKPRYVFYDGPPFATGLPHYGHILAGTVKDTVTRWAHQSGFHVERRFGWDCHGLPVEYEIDKLLGVKGPQDVEKMGINKYNQECRKIVMRYASEWETIVTRLGRWIDFDHDYKTMYPWFMESIWWVFKQLFSKGLVYRGFKVMPFSTACSTPLSNFESGQNYKEVDDPSVVVTFPLLGEASTSLVAWTTTPWTLTSNLALCVNPDLDYVKVKDEKTGHRHIVMETRLCQLYNQADQYSVLERMKGSKLEGLQYEPLFPYFSEMRAHGAFKVLTDSYVMSDAGTGVVHQAPYFGEDDYRISLAYGIINKDMTPVCPIDMAGRFVAPVHHFIGMHVKEADKHIIKHLRHEGRLLQAVTVRHSYPFCWRSDTPLIYRAVPSWFIRVEEFKERLLQTNAQTYWVPDFVKEKRFGNWLKDARDWAVSRNRYWGTPIPIWSSEDGEEVVCVGSIEELKSLTGVNEVNDLHREFIDHLTIPSSRGPQYPPLKRVSEVFDCWFESGSMPYAAHHYPFENRKAFEDHFPGNFIAEGIDQTRGWFYTLLVLSTALFDRPPFQNLICHGLVLASDGEKMSKRKKNYPDPMDVVSKYGADAVRLYLINSPVVRADNLRFKESGVKDVLKDVFLPWYNALKFLLQNVTRLQKEENVDFVFNEDEEFKPTNYMDRWIVSFTQSLIKFVHQEMKAYKLYTVVPQLLKFIEQLTNWYVRMNRKRLKGESSSSPPPSSSPSSSSPSSSPSMGGADDDCIQAITTLFTVIYSMIKVMAPFVPFLTEHMYQRLRTYLPHHPPNHSIHFTMLPTPDEGLIEGGIERAVGRMQAVVDLCRVLRERQNMPLKYPLTEIVVIHKDPQVLDDVRSLDEYIVEELNVKMVTVTNDKHKYKVHLRADADHRVLGTRLKKDHKMVAAKIKELTDEELEKFQKEGRMEVGGHLLTSSDVKVTYSFAGGEQQPYEAKSDGDMLVLLNTTPDLTMYNEGLAREVVNRVQKLRKKAHLVPTDQISIFYSACGGLHAAIEEHLPFIRGALKQPFMPLGDLDSISHLVIANNWQDEDDKKMSQVKGDELKLVIIKGHHTTTTPSTITPSTTNPSTTTPSTTTPCTTTTTPSTPCTTSEPHCRWVNVELKGVLSSILLENPRGSQTISLCMLLCEVKLIYGIDASAMVQLRTGDRVVQEDTHLLALHATTLQAHILT